MNSYEFHSKYPGILSHFALLGLSLPLKEHTMCGNCIHCIFESGVVWKTIQFAGSKSWVRSTWPILARGLTGLPQGSSDLWFRLCMDHLSCLVLLFEIFWTYWSLARKYAAPPLLKQRFEVAREARWPELVCQDAGILEDLEDLEVIVCWEK